MSKKTTATRVPPPTTIPAVIVPPTVGHPSLPTFDVMLTVLKFRDVVAGSGRAVSLTDHDIGMPKPKAKVCYLDTGTYQPGSKPITIQVKLPGAFLRFIVAGRAGDVETYQPVGIAFARADGTTPAAVFWGLGSRSLPNSPFSVTEVQPGILVVEDFIVRGQPGLLRDGKVQKPLPDCITYKFSVIIQRLSDGAVGIIDPYIENAN